MKLIKYLAHHLMKMILLEDKLERKIMEKLFYSDGIIMEAIDIIIGDDGSKSEQAIRVLKELATDEYWETEIAIKIKRG